MHKFIFICIDRSENIFVFFLKINVTDVHTIGTKGSSACTLSNRRAQKTLCEDEMQDNHNCVNISKASGTPIAHSIPVLIYATPLLESQQWLGLKLVQVGIYILWK